MSKFTASQEKKDGEQKVKLKGKEYVERVETKRGKDGIMETHVSYAPYKKKSYSHK